MTDQHVPAPDEADYQPDEGETVLDDSELPDDVRTGNDETAYNPPEDDPGADHEPTEEPA